MSIKRNETERLQRIANIADSGSMIYMQSDIDAINETFNKLLKEQRHKTKTEADLQSLFDVVVEHRLAGDSDTTTFNHLSDMSYMTYYDVFMDNQASIIQDRLKGEGLSPDILKHKGIKNNIDVTTSIDSNGIQIMQEVEENEDNYKVITEFEIYKDGRLIYSYSKEIAGEEYYQKEVKTYKTEYGVITERLDRLGRRYRMNEKGQRVNTYGFNKRTVKNG